MKKEYDRQNYSRELAITLFICRGSSLQFVQSADPAPDIHGVEDTRNEGCERHSDAERVAPAGLAQRFARTQEWNLEPTAGID